MGEPQPALQWLLNDHVKLEPGGSLIQPSGFKDET